MFCLNKQLFSCLVPALALALAAFTDHALAQAQYINSKGKGASEHTAARPAAQELRSALRCPLPANEIFSHE